jgi:antibiotic biosynthesis monooxygenase (ABM) superfamily enzyme
MIVLLTLYPVVMLEQMFLNPLLHSLGMAEAIFIGNLISVAALGQVLVPPANRAFDWWLRPISNGPQWTTAAGVRLIIGLYALSVSVFAWLS